MMKYLEKVFDATSAVVLVLNTDGAMVWMNRAGRRFTGYSQGDFSPPLSLRLFSKAGHDKIEAVLQEALSGTKPSSFDLPVKCADQTIKKIRWHVLVMEDEDAQASKWVVLCGDETACLGAQTADFDLTAERYRLFFENAGIGMMYIDEDTNIILVNKEFEKLMGYSKTEVEGKMQWPVLVAHADDLERMMEYNRLRKIEPALAPTTYNTKLRHKNSDILDVIVRVTVIPQTTFRLVSFLDMTQERKAEEAIRASEAKYRSLVENIQDGLYRCDLQGNLMFCNPSAARLVGYDRPDQIIGKNIIGDFFYSPAKRDEFLEQLNIRGSVSDYEVMLKHKNGSAVIISTSSHYFHDENGNVLGVEGLFTDITQRKQAEEKFLNVFMMAPDGISITRLKDGYILDANLGFESISGWKRLEVIGRTSLDLNFWADPADRDFLVRELMEGRDVRQKEYRFRQKDKTLREGLYSACLLKVAGEDCIIFVTQDITERKETEKIIKNNEERLRGITGNIPGLVFQFTVTETGRYELVYISERFSEFFGISLNHDTFFSDFLSRVHPDDQERLVQGLERCVHSGMQWDFEGRFIKPSGDLIWFQNLATPTRVGSQVLFNGITLDITARKKMEEMSRQSEEKFHKVFATTPDCITITRVVDEIILEVNRGFEEVTGWTRGEVLGRTSSEIQLRVDWKERERMLAEIKAGQDVLHREAMFRRKDGSLINVIYSARAISIDGEPSLIFVLHDITEEKRLEQERQKLEAQLFQSQKMDAIGQLASGVAHDFNNILTGIQGNASLIMMDYPEDHLHHQRLRRIEENVKRGANLTKQLLGFARGGKYEIRTLDVNDLVRKNAQLFTETKKEIEAAFELEDHVFPVEADAGQIDQVLLNIFINAGHAMPGGGNLYIQTANVTLLDKEAQAFDIPPGDYVRISISDTGTGMDQATLKRIFEPFFTTKAKQGGTGLGLASAYGIVRNHGGAITVQSEPGRGATFMIYLPASDKYIEKSEHEGFGHLVSGCGTILLVDDEPMILDSASEMLKMLGYTVYPAPTGQEALSVYMEKQKMIDLVILDMILPGMNGAQILKMLKDINPNVRVILSSGYSMQGDARNVMDLGCEGFIQKPYSFADLSKLVSKTIHLAHEKPK